MGFIIVIIRLMLSLLVWPKVITLSGFYCKTSYDFIRRTPSKSKHRPTVLLECNEFEGSYQSLFIEVNNPQE